MILDRNTIEFIELLSSKEPTPGGGGAAATVGALAAAMGLMVANLTTGKKKYEEVEHQVQEALHCLTREQKRLIELVDEDAKGFLPLAKAYKLPKNTKEEEKIKEEVMEEALFTASQAPLAIMASILKVMEQLKFLGENGSTLAISDAGVGALFAESAMKASSLNVFINTKMMKKEAVRKELNKQADQMIEKAQKLKEEIYGTVLKNLKGDQ
ncbi:MAG TPA: cyclodeaminase/cyclohydrolase family protein [Candidatus Dorea intestinavium]|nr:cyclodeaminase/cyclohydrolase family protein [Candidatus Dorea intestinavium]